MGRVTKVVGGVKHIFGKIKPKKRTAPKKDRFVEEREQFQKAWKAKNRAVNRRIFKNKVASAANKVKSKLKRGKDKTATEQPASNVPRLTHNKKYDKPNMFKSTFRKAKEKVKGATNKAKEKAKEKAKFKKEQFDYKRREWDDFWLQYHKLRIGDIANRANPVLRKRLLDVDMLAATQKAERRAARQKLAEELRKIKANEKSGTILGKAKAKAGKAKLKAKQKAKPVTDKLNRENVGWAIEYGTLVLPIPGLPPGSTNVALRLAGTVGGNWLRATKPNRATRRMKQGVGRAKKLAKSGFTFVKGYRTKDGRVVPSHTRRAVVKRFARRQGQKVSAGFKKAKNEVRDLIKTAERNMKHNDKDEFMKESRKAYNRWHGPTGGSDAEFAEMARKSYKQYAKATGRRKVPFRARTRAAKQFVRKQKNKVKNKAREFIIRQHNKQQKKYESTA